MATLRDLALAWSEAVDGKYPDNRAFTAYCIQAMFDAAATLGINDGADLPGTVTAPQNEAEAKYAERVERAIMDGLMCDPIPLSIALVLVAQFKDVVRSGGRS